MLPAVEVRPAHEQKDSLRAPALVVDLDGTLVKTDLLLESLLQMLKQKPGCLWSLPAWIVRGKATLKQRIAERVSLDVTTLPYREPLLRYLAAQHTEGRMLVLATGADQRVAERVADHLKFFDLVLASDGITNLCGKSKRDRLVREFGEKGFDYIGNGRPDVPVWASARNAIDVNPRPRAGAWLNGALDRVKALRPHHWLKNLLIFIPLFAAHRMGDGELLGKALLAFAAFACFASCGYLINDLFDLAADRHHPRKRDRPLASGNVPISFALWALPVLFTLGCLIGVWAAPIFLGVAAVYLALSATYSLLAKKVVLLDVLMLAGLYTLRIIAGSAAVSIWPSSWLLAFSTFFFFSLALVKRYSELVLNHVPARGYEPGDQELLASMGIASGYVAILVLALYINTSTARFLYHRYGLLWFLCSLLLYWISHIWLSAHRGRMLEEPLVFAAKDRTSRILILLMVAALAFAL